MCPSPDTRWPTEKFLAADPTSTISPQNSWPTTIGTGIVFCAHSSQLYMCKSVPQIAVLPIWISTSFGPGAGTGTRSIQIPGSGFDLTSAFIFLAIVVGSLVSIRKIIEPYESNMIPGSYRPMEDKTDVGCKRGWKPGNHEKHFDGRVNAGA
jgi:hypothetical protein